MERCSVCPHLRTLPMRRGVCYLCKCPGAPPGVILGYATLTTHVFPEPWSETCLMPEESLSATAAPHSSPFNSLADSTPCLGHFPEPAG